MYGKENFNMGRNNMNCEFGPLNKKKNYLGDILKIGAGFIAGSVCTLILVSLFGIFLSARHQHLETKDSLEKRILDDLNDMYDTKSPEDIRYFQVRSKKGEATIHTGMSKDSVIMLLGQPTEFSSTEYHDNITYRYGNYDMNSLSIDFKKGKVSCVSQY